MFWRQFGLDGAVGSYRARYSPHIPLRIIWLMRGGCATVAACVLLFALHEDARGCAHGGLQGARVRAHRPSACARGRRGPDRQVKISFAHGAFLALGAVNSGICTSF
eukprot:2163700-Rhodomonas_salina.3